MNCQKTLKLLLALALVCGAGHPIATYAQQDCADDCPDGGDSDLPPVTGAGGSSGGGGSSSGSGGQTGPSPGTMVVDVLNQNVAIHMSGLSTIPAPSAVIVYAANDPATGAPQGVFDNIQYNRSGVVPSAKGSAFTQSAAPLADTEPVGADGEFTVDETDFSLPGNGIPFVFARHYRSGIDYQSYLGYGWSNSYSQRLVATPTGTLFYPALGTPQPPSDLYLTTDRLELHDFKRQGVSSDGTRDIYTDSASAATLSHLRSDATAEWDLDDGSGLTVVFAGDTGLEQAVVDKANHSIRIAWLNGFLGPYITTITDTTGRTIYFNYAPLNLPVVPNRNDIGVAAQVPGYQNLQCLSLAPNCDNPLVSFHVNAIIAESVDLPNPNKKGAPVHNWNAEFDLIGVQDADGNGPAYSYYNSSAQWYTKEFDDYLPTKDAAEVYDAFSKTTPISQLECSHEAYLAVMSGYCSLIGSDYYDCSNFLTQKYPKASYSNLVKQCLAQTAKIAKARAKKQPKSYVYGTPPSLYHDLVSIHDADGRLVVQNRYGSDPFQVDFDRITRQVLAADPTNTTNFSYVDLTLANASARSAIAAFGPIDICPVASDGSYAQQNQAPNSAIAQSQLPALQVTVSGPLNRVTQESIDSLGRLLRSVDSNGVATNYNYVLPGVSGVLYPTGRRRCVAYTPAGRASSSTELPAFGHPGAPLFTDWTYDAANELVGQTKTSGGDLSQNTSIVRDSWERIIAVGEAVDSQHTRWTCFEYDDTTALRSFARSVGLPATPHPNGSIPVIQSLGGGRLENARPPCLPQASFGPLNVVVTSLAALPSQITRPDGSITKLDNITAAGPGDITVDAKGPAPQQLYFSYDMFGSLLETGQRHAGASDKIAGSVTTWMRDAAGLVQSMSEPDPSSSEASVVTTFRYDKSRNLIATSSPKLSRTFVTDTFGHVQSVTETPAGTSGATGQTRITCAKYDPYGAITEQISAEGVVTDFSYNTIGQLTEVDVGAKLQTPQLVRADAPCRPRYVPAYTIARTPAQETFARLNYNAVEQLSSATRYGLGAQYTYDGLDRLIDTFVLDHPGSPQPPRDGRPAITPMIGYHFAVGYQGFSKAWEAIADEYPPDGVLPDNTGGIHAAIEYSYDLVGRPLQIGRWLFPEEGATIYAPPRALTSFVYDDAANQTQITDSDDVIYSLKRDGADRPVLAIVGLDTPAALSISDAYAEAGAVVNETLTPAPTSTGSLARAYTYTPTGLLVSVTEEGRLVTQRQLDEFGRVWVEQRPGDVADVRQYDAFDELLSSQQSSGLFSQYQAAAYTWNRDGQPVSLTDGAQHSTTWKYDAQQRLQSATNGLGTTSYSYSPGTVLASTVVTPGARSVNTYSAAGRLLAVSVTDAAGRAASGNRSYQYSPLGQVTVATLSRPNQATETINVAYDSLGRRVSESDSLSPFLVTRVYGPLTEHLSITSSNASTSLDRVYNALRQPLTLQLNDRPIASWTYANGAPSTLSYANGTSLSFAYDPLGHWVGAHAAGSAGEFAAVTQSLGSDNIPHQSTLQVNSSAVETNLFQIDPSGRLLAEQSLNPGLASIPATLENPDVATLFTPASAQYQLDGAGNWLQRSGPAPLTTSVDAANRYTVINGNPVSSVPGGGLQAFAGQQYVWNGLDQLMSASNGTGSEQWSYDALGRASSQLTVSGLHLRMLWDGDMQLGVAVDGQPQSLTLYAGFSGQEVVAQATPGGLSQVFYHGPDASVFATADANGAPVAAYSYTAYGVPHAWNATGAPAQAPTNGAYLFQGASYDANLGLYSMGARFYWPAMGRFLSPDPIGVTGGTNLFAFVDDQPLTRSDPLGLSGRPSPGAAFHPSLWNRAIWSLQMSQDATDFFTAYSRSLAAPLELFGNIHAWVNGQGKWGTFSRQLNGVGSEALHRDSDAYLAGNLWGGIVSSSIAAAGIVQGLVRGAARAIAASVTNLVSVADSEASALANSAGRVTSPPPIPPALTAAATGAGSAAEGAFLPARLARIVPAEFAQSATLAAPGETEAFVTSASDIAGINTGAGLAQRLTLLDSSGNLIPGARAIIEFSTPAEGLASPVFRTNPGFIGGGQTAGGASEYLLPNLPINQLWNVTIRIVPP